MFVPASARQSLVERQLKEQENLEAMKRAQQDLEDRKRDSVQIVQDEIRREQERDAEDTGIPLDVDDTDLGVPEEFLEWKVRELKRLKRDREERLALELEQADTDARRAMTDDQLLALNPKSEKAPSSHAFLQKYHHRGAFYQDTLPDHLLNRPSLPTGLDKLDKAALPEVMQVKNFGRKGQSKYTHLTNEDTSRPDGDGWYHDAGLAKRYDEKRGGADKVSRPSFKAKP